MKISAKMFKKLQKSYNLKFKYFKVSLIFLLFLINKYAKKIKIYLKK